MSFVKTYPREIPGSNNPRWEEIVLEPQEEREEEQRARLENIYLLRQCIADARNVMIDEDLGNYHSHVIGLGIALFKKRASHAIYYKENRCRKKFEELFLQCAKIPPV
ncbi:hypothetical protein HY772_00415 [Candidatus Woesearchaeota archaeon]|nr:hypothetical protein [Candidatus Woesearchaeota archaeon]